MSKIITLQLTRSAKIKCLMDPSVNSKSVNVRAQLKSLSTTWCWHFFSFLQLLARIRAQGKQVALPIQQMLQK